MDRSQKDKVIDILDSFSGELLEGQFADSYGNYCFMGLLVVESEGLEPIMSHVGVTDGQIARVVNPLVGQTYGFSRQQWGDLVSVNDQCDSDERKQCVKDWIESL